MVAQALLAAVPGADDPLAGLLAYGPLGILTVLFVLGYIVGKPVLDRAVKERDEALAAYRELEKAFRETYVPLIERSNDASKEVIRVLTDFQVKAAAARRRPPAKD